MGAPKARHLDDLSNDSRRVVPFAIAHEAIRPCGVEHARDVFVRAREIHGVGPARARAARTGTGRNARDAGTPGRETTTRRVEIGRASERMRTRVVAARRGGWTRAAVGRDVNFGSGQMNRRYSGASAFGDAGRRQKALTRFLVVFFGAGGFALDADDDGEGVERRAGGRRVSDAAATPSWAHCSLISTSQSR